MSNEFKGYSTFNTIKNARLRAWNRVATFFNIAKDYNLNAARTYVDQFNEGDKQDILGIQEDIKRDGYAQVHREVSGSVTTH